MICNDHNSLFPKGCDIKMKLKGLVEERFLDFEDSTSPATGIRRF
jgi:hypothetical protein